VSHPVKRPRLSPQRLPTSCKFFIAAGSLVFLGAAACVFQWLPTYSLVVWILALFGAHGVAFLGMQAYRKDSAPLDD